MSTVTSQPSDAAYEDAVKMVEQWNQSEPSDEEKLKFLEQAIKDLGQPGNELVFKQAMEDLGIRGVKTDEAFGRVKNSMDTFVNNHWMQFPGIIQYQIEWSVYRVGWRGYMILSKEFAKQTAKEYNAYTLELQKVEKVTTKEEMQAIAANLTEFAKNKPIDIPVSVKDAFMELKRNVESFQGRFSKYLSDQGTYLTQKAESLRNEINALKQTISGLDQQIKDATLGLKIASWFGPIGAAIAGTALAILCNKRNGKQRELDGKKDELRKVEAAQTALGGIAAQFAGLVPAFELLTENLLLFADTWNSFHNEALDFATKFEKVEKPSALPSLYKGRIGLALAVSIPLTQGLAAYAASIYL